MHVIDSLADLRRARASLSGRIGLVPTMGALHAGHRALVETARAENDAVLVTIFVNPTQFAPTEDLSTYPRDLPGDLRLLEAAGVDLVFTPTPDLMYPPGYQTYVTVEEVTAGLEGASRPGHFRGVATVVSKLFNLTQPDFAYFGQKDAQQVAVLRRMVDDLNFPLTMVICPTVRESDGLAMSSRNVYLAPEQRAAAPVLYRALQSVGDRYATGTRDPETLRAAMRSVVDAEPLAEVEYISLTDARTLREVHQPDPTNSPLLASLAVRFGRTRLIDNSLLPFDLNTRAGLYATLGNPQPPA